jgi:hypothetical protein
VVENYVPGYVDRRPVTEFSMFRGYFTAYRDVQVPGYTETEAMRRFRTDVWSTRDGGKLIWSGTIETTEAPAADAARAAIQKQIAPELVTAGILPPRLK